MPKQKSKTATLFDIRLKNCNHDVLLLKGSEHNAASTFISGKIVLSVNEPISVKKITLRLYGTLRLRYTDARGSVPKPARFEKKVYEYVWDPAEISKYLNNMYENSSSGGSAAFTGASPPSSGNGLARSPIKSKASSTSLKSLGMTFRSMSSTSLSHHGNLTGHGGSSASSSSSNLNSRGSHLLVQGNYEFPFSAILPGDMPESVEGLPGASVVYKLESTIDRGKFHHPMVTKKHVRVVRTLTTDSVELSETVAVDNTWPKKVEYSLNVPSKAIAVGSGTPISLMLVPLLKGLQLGEIRISLVELYSYVGYLPPAYTDERIVCEKVIPMPRPDDPHFQMDKWEIDTFLRIPPSLSKCTQDCDIQTHVKVRHKLKFNIGLCNPDGHTSELRASLPVQIFISPFVTVSARTDDSEDLQEPQHHNENADEEVLFSSDPHNTSLTNLHQYEQLFRNSDDASPNEPLRSNPHSYSSFTGLIAPPMYEQHVYDQLWSDVSPMESPITSGASTPRSRPSADVLQFSMSSIDTAQLTENLRQLKLQRQLQEGPEGNTVLSPASRERAIFTMDGEQEGDYFARRPALQSHLLQGHNSCSGTNSALGTPGGYYGGAIQSPGLMTPPVHLSRTTSETNLEPDDMYRVPSYNEAIKGDVQDTLSPAYQPPQPGSNINAEEVNRRFEENISRSTTPVGLAPNRNNRGLLSRAGSSINLMSSSRASSNKLSPSSSRNVSSTNLSNLLGDNVSRQSLRRGRGTATFSMTPI